MYAIMVELSIGVLGAFRCLAAAYSHLRPSLSFGDALRNLPLNPLPAEVTNRIPEVKDLQFGFSGDKLVLADPLYHEVLAVIP